MARLRPRELLAPALLLGVAAALRLVSLNRGITGDEIILYGLATRPLGEIYGAVMAEEVYSPLGAYLLHAWIRLGGGEIWTRLYFVLFGLGLCAVVYALAREVLGRLGALVALAASALSPLLIVTSQYIRGYADGAFWSGLALLALIRIQRRGGGRGLWVLYGAATVIAFYAFYFTILFWGAILAWSAWRLRRGAGLRGWVINHIPVIAGMAPGLLMASHQLGHNASATRFNWSVTGFQIEGVHVGVLARNLLALLGFDSEFGLPGISRVLPAWFLLLLVLGVLGVCSVVLRLAWRRLDSTGMANEALLCLLVAFLPVVAGHVTGEWAGIFAQAKYLAVSHVAFLLLLTAAILALRRPWLSAAVVAGLVLAYSTRFDAIYRPEFDARRAESFIAATSAGATVLVLGPSPIRPLPGISWVDVRGVVTYDFTLGRYRVADPIALDRVLGQSGRIIYVRVYSNQEVFGGNRLVLGYLARRGYALQHTEQFKNIDVMVLNGFR